jgi:hypothetical protein
MIQQGLFGEPHFDPHIEDDRLARVFKTTPVEIRMMKLGLQQGVLSRTDVQTYLTQRSARIH